MTNKPTGEFYVPEHPLKLRVSAFLGSFAIWFFVHLLFLTCRKVHFGDELVDEVARETGGGYFGASWHRGLFYTVFNFRGQKAALTSSRSKDGELVTQLLKRFGYVTPRGSSGAGKGGRQALDEFAGYVRDRKKPGGIAVDGPKGPPYQSKHGIVAAAARTGAPIVPFMWAASRYWRINSWDRTVVPKPFSTIVMVFDRTALNVPVDADRERVEQARVELDERLNRLTFQAEAWIAAANAKGDPRDIDVPLPTPIPVDPPRKPRKKKLPKAA